ncbi:MAG: Twin-arginine translocation pathway signal, partial [Comamonadaceae bacterium]
FTELGFENLNDYPWYGVFAPVGTPQPVVDKFSAAIQKVLANPETKKKLTDMGLHVNYESQGQFAGRVRSYTQTWEGIIKSSGFQPQ